MNSATNPNNNGISGLLNPTLLRDILSQKGAVIVGKKKQSKVSEAIIASIIKQEIGVLPLRKTLRQIKKNQKKRKYKTPSNSALITKPENILERTRVLRKGLNNIYDFCITFGVDRDSIFCLERQYIKLRNVLFFCETKLDSGFEQIKVPDSPFISYQEAYLLWNYLGLDMDETAFKRICLYVIMHTEHEHLETIHETGEIDTSDRIIDYYHFSVGVLTYFRLRLYILSIADMMGWIDKQYFQASIQDFSSPYLELSSSLPAIASSYIDNQQADRLTLFDSLSNNNEMTPINTSISTTMNSMKMRKTISKRNSSKNISKRNDIMFFNGIDSGMLLVKPSTAKYHSMDDLSQNHGSMMASTLHLTSLPPIQMRKQLKSEEKTRQVFSQAGFDESFGRSTPRVLNYSNSSKEFRNSKLLINGGPDAQQRYFDEVNSLRKELKVAQEGVKQLNKMVDRNIAWVQSNCDTSSISNSFSERTKMKCRVMATERIFNVFLSYQVNSWHWVFQRWKQVIQYSKLMSQAESYSKAKGIQIMTSVFYEAYSKQLLKGWDVMIKNVRMQRYYEREAASIEIQRIGRGFVGKMKFQSKKRIKNAIMIQCLLRSLKAKWIVRELKMKRKLKRQNQAAKLIQKLFQKIVLIKQAKREVSRRRQHRSAIKIQKVARGIVGRQRFKKIWTERFQGSLPLPRSVANTPKSSRRDNAKNKSSKDPSVESSDDILASNKDSGWNLGWGKSTKSKGKRSAGSERVPSAGGSVSSDESGDEGSISLQKKSFMPNIGGFLTGSSRKGTAETKPSTPSRKTVRGFLGFTSSTDQSISDSLTNHDHSSGLEVSENDHSTASIDSNENSTHSMDKPTSASSTFLGFSFHRGAKSRPSTSTSTPPDSFRHKSDDNLHHETDVNHRSKLSIIVETPKTVVEDETIPPINKGIKQGSSSRFETKEDAVTAIQKITRGKIAREKSKHVTSGKHDGTVVSSRFKLFPHFGSKPTSPEEIITTNTNGANESNTRSVQSVPITTGDIEGDQSIRSVDSRSSNRPVGVGSSLTAFFRPMTTNSIHSTSNDSSSERRAKSAGLPASVSKESLVPDWKQLDASQDMGDINHDMITNDDPIPVRNDSIDSTVAASAFSSENAVTKAESVANELLVSDSNEKIVGNEVHPDQLEHNNEGEGSATSLESSVEWKPSTPIAIKPSTPMAIKPSTSIELTPSSPIDSASSYSVVESNSDEVISRPNTVLSIVEDPVDQTLVRTGSPQNFSSDDALPNIHDVHDEKHGGGKGHKAKVSEQHKKNEEAAQRAAQKIKDADEKRKLEEMRAKAAREEREAKLKASTVNHHAKPASTHEHTTERHHGSGAVPQVSHSVGHNPAVSSHRLTSEHINPSKRIAPHSTTGSHLPASHDISVHHNTSQPVHHNLHSVGAKVHPAAHGAGSDITSHGHHHNENNKELSVRPSSRIKTSSAGPKETIKPHAKPTSDNTSHRSRPNSTSDSKSSPAIHERDTADVSQSETATRDNVHIPLSPDTAATRIQYLFRRLSAVKRVNVLRAKRKAIELIKEEERRLIAKRNRSATIIESLFRALKARRCVKGLRAEREAALIEQKHYEFLKQYQKKAIPSLGSTKDKTNRSEIIPTQETEAAESDDQSQVELDVNENSHETDKEDELEIESSKEVQNEVVVVESSESNAKPNVSNKEELVEPSVVNETMIEYKNKDLEEKLKKFDELDAALKERERVMMENVKQAEERLQKAMQEMEKRAKEEEADRFARQQLLEMARGPITNRSDYEANLTGRSNRGYFGLSNQGNNGQTTARRIIEAPPTARSARNGAGIPYDAPKMTYEGEVWVQLWDPEQQSWYWYNEGTQQAQWEAPGIENSVGEYTNDSGYESAGAMTDYSSDYNYESGTEFSDGETLGGGGDWQEYWDEQAQAKYWYNNATGEASWTKPETMVPSSSDVISGRSSVTARQATNQNAEMLTDGTGGWISYIDDETGQEYWYNSRTGETTWA